MLQKNNILFLTNTYCLKAIKILCCFCPHPGKRRCKMWKAVPVLSMGPRKFEVGRPKQLMEYRIIEISNCNEKLSYAILRFCWSLLTARYCFTEWRKLFIKISCSCLRLTKATRMKMKDRFHKKKFVLLALPKNTNKNTNLGFESGLCRGLHGKKMTRQLW